MLLAELFDYKNQLMKDILTNEEVVRLVSEDKDFIEASELAYTRIFPYQYIPQTIQDGGTFICFDVDIQKVMNKTYYQTYIYVWVMSHRSKLRLPEGGVRPDKICNEICKMVDGSRFYGLGEANLHSVKHFSTLTDFQGKVMCFQTSDFNRQYDGTKPTPVNRKAR